MKVVLEGDATATHSVFNPILFIQLIETHSRDFK